MPLFGLLNWPVWIDICAPDGIETALSRAEAFMIDGRADYALMIEEDDQEKLRRKLEDLVDWGRYLHLGR